MIFNIIFKFPEINIVLSFENIFIHYVIIIIILLFIFN